MLDSWAGERLIPAAIVKIRCTCNASTFHGKSFFQLSDEMVRDFLEKFSGDIKQLFQSF
jgi:hypothetical protein